MGQLLLVLWTTSTLRLAIIMAIVVATGASSISCSSEPGNANEVAGNSQSSPSPAVGAATNSGAATSAQGSIRANPNPVPAGPGNGRTQITWKTTGDVTPVEVFVVQDTQPEVKFAEGTEGTADAPWIVAGSNYEFRLYAGSGATRKLIDKIQVTRTP